MCPGSTGRGQLTRLPAAVRPDPAERGPSPGPPLSARLQEPAEPPDPGGELQPRAVPTAGRVSQTPLTSRLDIELQNLCLGLSREDRLIKSFRNGCERCCQNSQILCFPSRSESALDRLVQVLEVLITGELNMNQAAPGKSKLSDPYQRWLGLNWIISCSVLAQFFLPQCRCRTPCWSGRLSSMMSSVMSSRAGFLSNGSQLGLETKMASKHLLP